jgi:hypothetical protein
MTVKGFWEQTQAGFAGFAGFEGWRGFRACGVWPGFAGFDWLKSPFLATPSNACSLSTDFVNPPVDKPGYSAVSH